MLPTARSNPTLLAVPNASAGADERAVTELGRALAPPTGCVVRLLDVHRDADHDRSVFTLAGAQGELASALVRGARVALELVDLRRQGGVHPRVGALDVAPVIYPDHEARGAAVAEALTAAALIGEDLGVPVFLYGDLATDPERRERAAFRAGGPERLAERIELARRIAAEVRESGGGLRGVRALGLALAGRGRAQVSFNVHDPYVVPLRELVAAVRARAPVASAELVGLAPAAALDGFPDDVPMPGFDPARHLIENALRSLAEDGEDDDQAPPQAPRNAGGNDRPGG